MTVSPKVATRALSLSYLSNSPGFALLTSPAAGGGAVLSVKSRGPCAPCFDGGLRAYGAGVSMQSLS